MTYEIEMAGTTMQEKNDALRAAFFSSIVVPAISIS